MHFPAGASPSLRPFLFFRIEHHKWVCALVVLGLSVTCATIASAYVIYGSYSIPEPDSVPAGEIRSWYAPVSDAPADAYATRVEARFSYTAYNGVEDCLTVRFRKDTAPGSTFGTRIVAPGTLPAGNPGTTAWFSVLEGVGFHPNGNYWFSFIVDSGCAYDPTIHGLEVRITYEINQPDINLSTYSVSADIVQGTSQTKTVQVWNVGDATLDVSGFSAAYISPLAPAWIENITPSSMSIISGSYQTLYFDVNAAGLPVGARQARLYVYSDDPDESTIYITVNMDVVSAADPQVSSTSGERGSTLYQPGWGFTPYGTAELHFRRPDGSLSPTTTEAVAGDGTYDHYWTVTNDAQVGTYQYWAVDLSTGLDSPEVSYSVSGGSLDLLTPSQGTIVTTDQANFSWSDTGADYYELWVDDNASFSSPVVNPQHFQPFDLDQLQVTTLQWGHNWFPTGVLYWKVRANTGGTYVESSTWSFSYAPTPAADPVWDPLYRLYNPTTKDHFYCTSYGHQLLAQDSGYFEEGVEGHVSTQRYMDADLVPIFRLWDDGRDCHYYTSDFSDCDALIATGTYVYEGITGYGLSAPRDGWLPLYGLRLDDGGRRDNFYTTSEFERQNAIDAWGFAYLGVLAYVSPSGDLGAMAWSNTILMAGLGVSTDNGNFKHHETASFDIPGNGLPLRFSHQYNSLAVFYPAEVRSLGVGWMHEYSSCITESGGLYRVFWANGSVHLYDAANDACLVEGVYDDLTTETANRVTVRRKNQVVYVFERPAAGYPLFLKEIRDRNGNTVTCTYETTSLRRLLRVTGPAGRQLTFTYRAQAGFEDLVGTVTDPAGRQIHFAYADTTRDLTGYTDPEGHTTTYVYDDAAYQDHRLVRVELPDGTAITNEYADRMLTSQFWSGQSGGLSVSYGGNVATVSYSGSSATGYSVEYYPAADAWQAPKPRYVTSGGDQAELLFDNPSHPALPSGIVDPRGNYHGFFYDTAGNMIEESHPLGAVYQYTYDQFNNVTSVVDPLSHTTTNGYDANGNQTSVTEPGGHVTTLGRDGFGRLTSVSNYTGTYGYQYDGYGNLVRVTDPLGNATIISVDLVGRVQSVTNAKGQTTTYTTNDRGLVTSVQDTDGGIMSLAYDQAGRMTDVSGPGPASTTWGYTGGLLSSYATPGCPASYVHNGDGSVASRTRPLGTTSYNYDAAGYLTGIDGVTLSRDAGGNLVGTLGSACDLTMVYDALNRLTSITDEWGNTVDFAYDAAGNTTRITYGPGRAVDYTYDSDNRLQSVTDWNGLTVSYTYRPDGLASTVTRSNGTTTAYSYDGGGRLDGITHTGPGGTLASYVYGLDALGNIASATVTGPLGPPELVPASRTATVNTKNQVTAITGTTFGYDGNGNVTSMSGERNLSLTYDEENRLTSISGNVSAGYVYDVFGNRRQSTVDGATKRYVLDPRGASRVLFETNSAGNPLNYYIYGLNLVGRIKADGAPHYYHGDNVGSVVVMTDVDGHVTHSYCYDPFGRPVDQEEADPNPFTFVGLHGVMAEKAGLYFMQARYYDSVVGRFCGEDPIWSSNLYFYAGNNPVALIDPEGTWPSLGKVFRETMYFAGYTATLGNCFQDKVPFTVKIGATSAKMLVSKHWLGAALITTVDGTFLAGRASYRMMTGRYALKDIISDSISATFMFAGLNTTVEHFAPSLHKYAGFLDLFWSQSATMGPQAR